MHNGLIREFARVKRTLMLAVDDALFPSIEGTTDSEAMFYLALTFGLERDPAAAVARMVGFVEETGREHGVELPIQMSVATTDGDEHLGVPLLERGRLALAVLQHSDGRPEGSLPRERGARAGCRTRPGSSSPSRWATSPAPGTRCRRRTSGSCSRGPTSCGPSSPNAHDLARPGG